MCLYGENMIYLFGEDRNICFFTIFPIVNKTFSHFFSLFSFNHNFSLFFSHNISIILYNFFQFNNMRKELMFAKESFHYYNFISYEYWKEICWFRQQLRNVKSYTKIIVVECKDKGIHKRIFQFNLVFQRCFKYFTFLHTVLW